MNVNGDTSTSSPASTPATAIDVWSAVVPLAVARHALAPISAAYLFSNSATCSPPPLHHLPERNISRIPGSALLSQYGQSGHEPGWTLGPPLIASFFPCTV